jgi:hypothetical protein
MMPWEFFGSLNFTVREDVRQVVEGGGLRSPTAWAERVEVGLSGGGQGGIKLQLFFREQQKSWLGCACHIYPFGNIILRRNYNKY